MKDVVAIIFGLGLIINALLFVPQALTIWRSRSARGVSIVTFCGFGAMQLIGVIHGYYQEDWSLAIGMAVSFVACGSVTVLAIVFRDAALDGREA
ncbi:MAG: hypothetical protein H0X36_02550 [Sphingomonadaceae bacterium]|nr:hypothetical protein [Sphingomonadaceae bacterium]